MGNYKYLLMLILIVIYSTISTQDQSEFEPQSENTSEQIYSSYTKASLKNLPSTRSTLKEILVPIEGSNYIDILIIGLVYTAFLFHKGKKNK